MKDKFKYNHALKMLEIGYNYYGNDSFSILFNGFLSFYDLKIPDKSTMTFQNAIDYLNSISYIMVEKFLCVHSFYNSQGKPSDFERYDYYYTENLDEFESRDVKFKVKTEYNTYLIKINEDNIFYCPNSHFLSYIINIFKNPKKNKKCFINSKDLAYYYKEKNEMTSTNYKQMFELDKLDYKFKKIIGKKIESAYKLD